MIMKYHALKMSLKVLMILIRNIELKKKKYTILKIFKKVFLGFY